MKTADLETLIWLIVAVLVVVAKGWNKLQQSIDKDSTQSKDAQPVARSRPQRSRPQLPPAMRRTAQSSPPAAPRAARSQVEPPPPREPWRAQAEQFRRLMEQLSGQPQQPERAQPRPVPPPIAPPPGRKTEVTRPQSAPSPEPQPVAVAHAPAPAAKPAMPETRAPAPAPAPTPRAALWAEALRDKQNIRNIIISAEIIGPPKAFQ